MYSMRMHHHTPMRIPEKGHEKHKPLDQPLHDPDLVDRPRSHVRSGLALATIR
jgi:hypothetical protein